MLICNYLEKPGDFVIAEIGAKSPTARVFGDDWATRAVGKKNVPDAQYDHRVSSVYAPVLDEGRPRVDHVRALIRRDGRDPVWAPYRRLLMPGSTDKGVAVVICLSELTQEVDIPFLAVTG